MIQILILKDLKSILELIKMRVLIFDTETTGLPQSRIISPDTLEKWPHIVQFSFIIFDTESNDIVETKDYIIKLPKDIEISAESTAIHGITNEISQEKGVFLAEIILDFFDVLGKVDLLVGHNISFDINMLNVELLRIIYKKKYPQDIINDYKFDLHYLTNLKNIYCTMQESIDLCAINAIGKTGREYKKFPKLSELHVKLFESVPKNLHNSLIDILITLRCFMKLKFDRDILLDCENFSLITKHLEIF